MDPYENWITNNINEKTDFEILSLGKIILAINNKL